jgi:Bifunctional DNA primase/polymerase, N-terminal
MLQWSLKYLSLGLSVIPLKPNSKVPLVPWTEFQNRRASESEVKEWWGAVPNANIGIVTGKISGIAVIDLDGPKGLSSAAKMGFTSSLVSLTGLGRHLWFAHAENVKNSVRVYPGIDIRSDGGFVVVPPSVHENGVRYRWIGPLALNAVSISSLPLFPAATFVDTVSQTKVFKEESWVSKALQEMKNGNIDETLFTVCSRLRSDGYSADDARILLQPHADRAGAEVGHLDEKIENVWNRYEPRRTSSVF